MILRQAVLLIYKGLWSNFYPLQHFQTKVVQNNGYNPVYNENFPFKCKMKSLGLLYVAVYDSDTLDSDDFIAYSTIPLNSLKPGVRNICLRSYNGNNSGEFQFCSVMARITFN